MYIPLMIARSWGVIVSNGTQNFVPSLFCFLSMVYGKYMGRSQII